MKLISQRALIVLITQMGLAAVLAEPILIEPQSRPIIGSDINNVRVTRQSADGTEITLTMDFNYDGMSGPDARIVPVISDKKRPQVSRWFGCNPARIGIGKGTISVKVKFFNDEPGVPAEVTTDRIRILLLNGGGLNVIQQSLVLKTLKWGNPNAVPSMLPPPKVVRQASPELDAQGLERKRLADEQAKAKAAEEAQKLASLQAEAERKAQEARKLQQDLEDKRVAEEKRLAQAKADADAKAKEEARLKSEADAKRASEVKRLAEEKARQDAEAKTREEARLKAEAEAKTREEARLRDEAEAKRLAETKRLAEQKSREELTSRERARLQAQEQVLRETEQKRLAEEKIMQQANTFAEQGSVADLDQLIRDSPGLEPRLAPLKQRAQAVRADVLVRAGAFVDSGDVDGIKGLQQQFHVPELDSLASQAGEKTNSLIADAKSLAAKGDTDGIASLEEHSPKLKDALEPERAQAGTVASNVLQQADAFAQKAQVAEVDKLVSAYPALAVRLDPIKHKAEALRADVLKKASQFVEEANVGGIKELQQQYSVPELEQSAAQAQQTADSVLASAKSLAQKADAAGIVDLEDRYPSLKPDLEQQRSAAQTAADQVIQQAQTAAQKGLVDELARLVQDYPHLRARLAPLSTQAKAQTSDAVARATSLAAEADVAGIQALQQQYHLPEIDKLVAQAQQQAATVLAEAKSSADKADLGHIKDLEKRFPRVADLENSASQAREKANQLASQSKTFADKGDETSIQDLETNYPALKDRLEPELARATAFAEQTAQQAATLAARGGVGGIDKIIENYPALRGRLESARQKAETARSDALNQATNMVAKADAAGIKNLETQYTSVTELEKLAGDAAAIADQTMQRAQTLAQQAQPAEISTLAQNFPALQSRLEPLARRGSAARVAVLARANSFLEQVDAASIVNLTNQYPQMTELADLAGQASQRASQKISDAEGMAKQGRVSDLEKLTHDFPALQSQLQPLQDKARTQLTTVLTQATNFVEKADAASVSNLVSQYPQVLDLQSLVIQASQKADDAVGKATDFAQQGQFAEIDKLVQSYPALQARLTPIAQQAQDEIKIREEARLKAAAEAKRLLDERAKAEADARAREEARLQAEAEAKRVAEETRVADEQAKVAAVAREAQLKAEAEARARELARLQAEVEAKAHEAERLKAEAEAKRIAEEKRLAEEKRMADERAKAELAAASAPKGPGSSGTAANPQFVLNNRLRTKVSNVDVVNRSLDRTEMTIGVEFAYSPEDGPAELGVDLASTDEPEATGYFASPPQDLAKGKKKFALFPIEFRPPPGGVGPSFPTDKIWIYLKNDGEKSYIFTATMLLVWRPPAGQAPAAAALPKSTVQMESFKQNDPFSGYVAVKYNLTAADGKLRLRVYDSAKPASVDWFQSDDVPVKNGLGVQLVRIVVPGNSRGPDLFNADTIEITLLAANGQTLASLKSQTTMTWARPK